MGPDVFVPGTAVLFSFPEPGSMLVWLPRGPAEKLIVSMVTDKAVAARLINSDNCGRSWVENGRRRKLTLKCLPACQAGFREPSPALRAVDFTLKTLKLKWGSVGIRLCLGLRLSN